MIRVVRLGSDRHPEEGLRIGTVRRPPRGVRKERLAADDWYDAWLPELAPGAALVALGLAATTSREWNSFVRRYRAAMNAPEKKHLIALLAALSRSSNFSVGCYCEDEDRCHRSVLRDLLRAAGADIGE